MTDFIPSRLARLDAARMRAYKDNLDFYNGLQWPGAGRERRLVFNYARAAIDKVASYLMQGFNLACDPLEDRDRPGARRAEQAIRRVLDDNDCAALDYETEVDAAILGDGCYKVTWDSWAGRVRITAPDVAGIYCWRTGDDVNEVYQVASRYQLTAEQVRAIYGHDITGPGAWITERWTAAAFTLYLDDAVITDTPNPYGFIPFIIFPNLRQPKAPWGLSDIPAIVETQRELNRAMSQLSRILELSGNPIAVLENVEASEAIRVQPGAVWHLPETSKAYLLDLLKGGGARLHIDYIDLIYRCLHDLAEAPRAAFGGIEQELSGVALEVELNSLLQKVARKRTIRAAVYRKRHAMVLSLLAKYAGVEAPPLRHRIVWGSIIPQDKSRQAQNEQMLVASGVHSRRRAMDETGIEDPDQEFGRWLEERRAILKMNQELRLLASRGGTRERDAAASAGDEAVI